MKKISILNTVRGFTLIEILIVVAIIAILAGSVLVGFGPAQRQGRDTRRISDLRQVQNALGLYYAKCGYYPGTTQAGSTCSGFSTTNWAGLYGTNGRDGVLAGSNIGTKQIPNDPTSGRNYLYGSSDGTGYILGAVLEDVNNPAMQSSAVIPGTCGVSGNTAIYCIEF